MKKTYTKPSTLMTKVGVQKMICGSNPQVGINRSGSIDADKVDSRRSNDLWDDDEEE